MCSSHKRGVRKKWKRSSPADPKTEARKGRRCLGAKGEIPLQPKDKTMLKQIVILELMEDQSGADIHIAGHEEPQSEAGRHTLMEAAAHEEPSQE